MTDDERSQVQAVVEAFEAETPDQPVIVWRSTRSTLFSGAVDIDRHGRTSPEDAARNVRSMLAEVRAILPNSRWQLALDDQQFDWHEPLAKFVADGTDGPSLLRDDSEISRPSTAGGMLAFTGVALIIGGFILAMFMAGGFESDGLFAFVVIGLLAMLAGAVVVIAGLVVMGVGATAEGIRTHRRRLR
jgi:hypothetical protein